MDRTKTIHANHRDHGTSFSDVSICLKKANQGVKTFLTADLLALLAGWMSPMASTGGSIGDARLPPAHPRQLSSSLPSMRESFWFKGEMTAWLVQEYLVERLSYSDK
jgi:hypothetical protein